MKYSVIIPVYNEEKNIIELHERVKKVMDSLQKDYEIIIIDDGSDDNTYSELLKLSPVKLIKFRKNFGQTAAMDAGIKEAEGEILITLDGDLQNPPEEIPKLLNKMQEGFDVVSGWRHKRKDTFGKKFISRGANVLRKFFIDDKIHDSGCSLKAYKKECFHQIDLYGEIHRFIPGILLWQGYKVGEVEVEHVARQYGQTKYNYKRILKGFVDMIGVWFWRKYASRPLHIFGGSGILLTLIGSTMLFSLFILRLFFNFYLSNRIWPTISVFLILAGIQLFVSGLLGEILIKNYFNDKRRPYNIERVIKN
ncbi:MAG: glycosyltransferase family 2 protein [Patescibacteria group bacterium]